MVVSAFFSLHWFGHNELLINVIHLLIIICYALCYATAMSTGGQLQIRVSNIKNKLHEICKVLNNALSIYASFI